MKTVMRRAPLGLPSPRLSPLMLLLLGVLGVFVAFAAVLAIRSIDQPVAIATESVQRPDWRLPTLAASGPIRSKAASADVETLTRPIFAKSRRPVVAQAPQSEAGAKSSEDVSPPAGLALAAITKFHGIKRAFIVSTSAPRGKWIDVGEQIEGWTIVDMEGSELTLKNNSRSARVRLYSGSNKS